jgi:hypothetical protein
MLFYYKEDFARAIGWIDLKLVEPSDRPEYSGQWPDGQVFQSLHKVRAL